MKLLESKNLKLPKVFFITDKEEIKDIPIGVPFIFGDKSVEKHLIRILEYEILYQAAMRSGYPFNFKKILKEKGYKNLENFYFNHPVYMDINSEDVKENISLGFFNEKSLLLQDYIRDSSAYVDVTKLKELNVFPLWLDKIEEAISTNIHNFAVFNSNMYNKKLE